VAAICTLLGKEALRSPRPARIPATRRPAVVTPAHAAASKLEAIEDDLQHKALDRHPRSEAALDAALDDMAALSAELQRSRRRPLLLRSTTNLNHIEDLLLEAVIRTHPNRERALDRLMGDLTDVAVEPDERNPGNSDTFVDNDFDG